MARPSSDGFVMCYVLPLLWITPCVYTVRPFGRIKHDLTDLFSASTARWPAADRGGEADGIDESAARRTTTHHSVIQARVPRTNHGSVLTAVLLLTHTVPHAGCKNRPDPFPGWMSYTKSKHGFQVFNIYFFIFLLPSLQCFDTVGWSTGWASVCKTLSDGVLAWLSVWGVGQISVCPSWYHCHLLSFAPANPDWFYLSGTSICLPSSKGCAKELCYRISQLDRIFIRQPCCHNQELCSLHKIGSISYPYISVVLDVQGKSSVFLWN